MIRRATLDDVAQVNEWAGADFTEFLSNEMNVCLVTNDGGAIFAWRGPGIYEVHVFFKQRGREVLALSERMLHWMRRDYGAKLFWAAIPTDEKSRRVIMFTRLMGWKFNGKAVFPHGECEIYVSENA